MVMKKVPDATPFDRSSAALTSDFFNIPLLGMVRPGDPDDSNGDYQLSELIANYPSHTGTQVTLQVVDNAMYKAGILKHDFLTVQLNQPLNSGDFAVVKLGERVFVRRFSKQNGLVRLETADDYPSSLIIEPDTPGFELIGKVISITRVF